MKLTLKKVLSVSLIFSLFFPVFAKSSIKNLFSRKKNTAKQQKSVIPQEPDKLYIFKKAYPDIIFTSEYQEDLQDWKITMEIPNNGDRPSSNSKLQCNNGDKPSSNSKLQSNNGDRPRIETLYWSNGSLLPQDELINKDKYWTLLYHYSYEAPLAEPADFTPEQIERLKSLGSNESRKNGAGTPMFFFDAIYDSTNRVKLETHITHTTFLGKRINIHERIKAPLKKVELRIQELAAIDPEVQTFIDGLRSTEAYFWRVIANTNRKSFHSLGIAVDVLPKSYQGKDVYWSWAKDRDPENWMLTPLKRRWMPPQSVIKIFEEEGFIWGGKWGIWDNMHFEYHPELIYFSMEESEATSADGMR